jgi:hypothetical protein
MTSQERAGADGNASAMKKPALAALAAVVVAVAVVLVVTVPATAATVTVSPAPGTRTASYKTQISFRGVPADQLGSIRVRGSRSGVHRGRLRPHSDGQGASLVFNNDFRRGESVTVVTALAIPDAQNGDYRFKVAGLGNASEIILGTQPVSDIGRGKRERYRSRPDLSPPRTTIDVRRPGTGSGLLFLNGRNRTGRGQQGPLIVDDAGEVVWFKPVGERRKATDVRTQTYQGNPVLTYWVGKARQGNGAGENVILDQAYRPVARVRAGNGYRADLHEFLITPQNTAIVMIYNPIERDLSSMGGSSRSRVVDSIVQEIDIPTGLVLFEWHSLGQVGLAESYGRVSRNPALPFDYMHINAATLDADGNLLLSGRDTWAVYKVDRRTGEIKWRLGGKRSTFKLSPGARFAWQHDVERRADGTISLFDNGASPPVRKRSRGLVLAVDEQTKTARAVKQYQHPRGLLAANQGSLQTLPNGNVFIGWGSQRYFSEYTADGELLFDGRLSVANDHYRAVRQRWTGRPATPPAIAAEPRGSKRSAVYASYNGATGVATWEVLAGGQRTGLVPVATARRTGFETAVSVGTAGPYFAVRAKDAKGQILGTSKTVRRRSRGG